MTTHRRTARRHALLTAATAALLLTAGCGSTSGATADPNTRPPTVAASGPAVRLPAMTPATTTGSGSPVSAAPLTAASVAGPGSPAPAAVPISSVRGPLTRSPAPGAPSNETQIDHPTYTLGAIDRRVATQVAYAYLTLRLSYTWRDPAQGAGIRRAAAYASPAHVAAMIHNVPTAATDAWKTAQRQHVSAAVKITSIQSFAPLQPGPGRSTLTVLSWQQTSTSTAAAATTSSGNTTVTLLQGAGGTFAVTADSFGQPN